MAAKDAVLILDTLIDIFEQMSVGNALGIQVQEIARCLHQVRLEISWTPVHALAASKIRAKASLYAMWFEHKDASSGRRARNEARLDEVRADFIGLRCALVQQASEEDSAVCLMPAAMEYERHPDPLSGTYTEAE